MAKLTIRCHPLTPADHDDLEAWLEDQVSQLRRADPEAIIRLARLTQDPPSGEMGIGWVLELELVEEPALTGKRLIGRLDELIRDMRLLGLQPVTLAPYSLGPSPTPPAPPKRRPPAIGVA